ncbi:MAG: SLBB domain-containing protein [Pyrinomonadaceae bacterium]
MKMYSAIPRFLFLLLILFCLSAKGLSQEATPTATPVPSEDLVHFGDLIDVDVVGEFEFDWRGKLNSDGSLDGFASYGDPIAGVCRSVEGIAADVAKALSKILREPKVVVRIIDRSDRAVVRLEGAVKTPTRFRVRRPVKLQELIVMAGGLTDASSGEVTILRAGRMNCSSPADNKTETIVIKISELLTGKEAANPRILSGDLVTATTANLIYVIGAVKSPQSLSSREQMTVTRAIAMVGGLVKNADAGKITIFRREAGETRIVDVDLDKIKKGEMVDEFLRPFDILDVAAKGGEKRKFPPVSMRDDSREKIRGELPLKIVE